MVYTETASLNMPFRSTKQIVIISLIALILGHIFTKTYLVWAGLFIVPLYLYHYTLRKHDLFSFLMVIYFCGAFPYLEYQGGAFNMVGFICILFYSISNNKFPAEKRVNDKWFKFFVGLFIVSSILGWILNYTGNIVDFYYSFISFFGVVFLLLLSGRMEITRERIKIFLQLNIVLIFYSTIVSINKYLHIVTFRTPLMPIYGQEGDYFEGGGIIGSSPLYGEHSLILLMLFSVFLMFNNQTINIKRSMLLGAAIIAYVNVFMSISRSVFLLSIGGFLLLFLLQFKITEIRIGKIFQQIAITLLFIVAMVYIINSTRINYVFQRVEEIEETNKESGGITIDRILDGSALNREEAFYVAKQRYESKDSWIIGYGWGTAQNNRSAFYVDTKIKRSTAHSQIFAIFFLFGWIGSIAYWGLIFRIIYRAFKISGNKKIERVNRLMAYFFLIAFCLFLLNEIKADSISVPTYFGVTFIWMGLAFATFNTHNKKTSALNEIIKNS